MTRLLNNIVIAQIIEHDGLKVWKKKTEKRKQCIRHPSTWRQECSPPERRAAVAFVVAFLAPSAGNYSEVKQVFGQQLKLIYDCFYEEKQKPERHDLLIFN